MLRSKDLLRKALLANAALSGLAGLVLIVASGAIAGLLGPGVSASLLVALGVADIGFAIAVAAVARPRDPDVVPAAIVTGINAFWVLGSGAALAAFFDQLSTAGFWIIVAQAAIVADLALVQGLGLRRRLQDRASAAASTA